MSQRCFFSKYIVFSIIFFSFSGLADVQHEESISAESVRAVLSQVKELKGQNGSFEEKKDVEGKPESMDTDVDKKIAVDLPMLDFDVLETSVQKIEKQVHDLEQEIQVLKKRISWLKDVADLLKSKQQDASEKKIENTKEIKLETKEVPVDKKQEIPVVQVDLHQTPTTVVLQGNLIS